MPDHDLLSHLCIPVIRGEIFLSLLASSFEEHEPASTPTSPSRLDTLASLEVTGAIATTNIVYWLQVLTYPHPRGSFLPPY